MFILKEKILISKEVRLKIVEAHHKMTGKTTVYSNVEAFV